MFRGRCHLICLGKFLRPRLGVCCGLKPAICSSCNMSTTLCPLCAECGFHVQAKMGCTEDMTVRDERGRKVVAKDKRQGHPASGRRDCGPRAHVLRVDANGGTHCALVCLVLESRTTPLRLRYFFTVLSLPCIIRQLTYLCGLIWTGEQVFTADLEHLTDMLLVSNSTFDNSSCPT